MIRAGAPRAGLCESCRHHRWTSNRRGSSFLLCGKSAADPSFRKYPQLPVRACAGYEPGASADSESAEPTDPSG